MREPMGLIPISSLTSLKKGFLECVTRGVYRNPSATNDVPFEWQYLLETAQRILEGAVCGVSAPSYYGLMLEFPCKFWITVPHSAGTPRREKTKILRM
jgi:predicted transcriptional regulator of viral defense system